LVLGAAGHVPVDCSSTRASAVHSHLPYKASGLAQVTSTRLKLFFCASCKSALLHCKLMIYNQSYFDFAVLSVTKTVHLQCVQLFFSAAFHSNSFVQQLSCLYTASDCCATSDLVEVGL